jgi:hypothetical protein
MNVVRRFPLLFVAAWLAAGCSGHVETELNPGVRIAAGDRYAWETPGNRELQGERNPLANSPALNEKIHRAVDAELARKGLRLVGDVESADFTVHYHLGITRRREWVGDTMPGPWGPVPYAHCGRHGCHGAWAWGWYGPPEIHYREVTYREGTLMLDLTERTTGRIAFRAVGRKPVERDDVTEAGVRDAVEELLEDLEVTRQAAATGALRRQRGSPS